MKGGKQNSQNKQKNSTSLPECDLSDQISNVFSMLGQKNGGDSGVKRKKKQLFPREISRERSSDCNISTSMMQLNFILKLDTFISGVNGFISKVTLI